MMKAARSPRRRAACTYSRSRSATTAARMVRATSGVNRMPMTRITIGHRRTQQREHHDAGDHHGDGEQDVDAAHEHVVDEAAVEAGDEADGRPRNEGDAAWRAGATISTERAPAMVRDMTSRPRSSVPNQCWALGGASVCRRVDRRAARSASRSVEKSAMKTQKAMMPAPTRNVGLVSSLRSDVAAAQRALRTAPAVSSAVERSAGDDVETAHAAHLP